jgi:Fe-S-cluster-containing dehydrogenase component
VLACPFGVPKMNTELKLMMKCDMCYDRTSAGKRPMCATVCPSGALYFGTRNDVEQMRTRSIATNRFRFGEQTITTKVNMMLPRSSTTEYVDVTSAMNERSVGRRISLNVLDETMFVAEDGE